MIKTENATNIYNPCCVLSTPNKRTLQYLIQQKRVTSHNNKEKAFFTDHQFFNQSINTFNTPFSGMKQNLLAKGFKHNIQTNFNIKDSETLGIDTEIALKDIPNNIQNKAKQNKVIFTRADKDFFTGRNPPYGFWSSLCHLMGPQNAPVMWGSPT